MLGEERGGEESRSVVVGGKISREYRETEYGRPDRRLRRPMNMPGVIRALLVISKYNSSPV